MEKGAPCRFVQKNPKPNGTMAFTRYERYKRCCTLASALQCGATRKDIVYDAAEGYLKLKAAPVKKKKAMV